jgi:hypothetical protein
MRVPSHWRRRNLSSGEAFAVLSQNDRGRPSMRTYAAVLGATALLISSGIATAQSQTPRNYDSSGAPKSGSEQPRSGGGLTSGTTGAGGGAGMTGAPSSAHPQAPSGATGAPSVEKGSGNSSLPSGGAR